MNDKIKMIIKVVIAIICLVLVFQGRKNIGYAGLLTQLTGVVGLLTLLFLYNKKYQ